MHSVNVTTGREKCVHNSDFSELLTCKCPDLPRSNFRFLPKKPCTLSRKALFLLMRHSAVRIIRRGLTTAAAHPPHAAPSSSHVTASTSAIPLSNVEAQWATLNPTEQTAVHQQLEELQRKDWKSLSLAEKKAGMSCPSPNSCYHGWTRSLF
jgi:hypothetical protein